MLNNKRHNKIYLFKIKNHDPRQKAVTKPSFLSHDFIFDFRRHKREYILTIEKLLDIKRKGGIRVCFDPP